MRNLLPAAYCQLFQCRRNLRLWPALKPTDCLIVLNLAIMTRYSQWKHWRLRLSTLTALTGINFEVPGTGVRYNLFAIGCHIVLGTFNTS